MASSSLLALAALLAVLSFITPSSCFNPKNINHNTPEDALGASADYSGKFAMHCLVNIIYCLIFYLIKREKFLFSQFI
jgi:hypothetical protein